MKATRLAALAIAATLARGAEATAPRALLDRYCVMCHNESTKTAGITLDTMRVDDVGVNGQAWEKVLRKVRTAEMPPAKLPRPNATDTAAFTSWLQTSLDRAAAAHPNPGRPTIHRLNRAEYSNAVRDMLALDINAGESLPADDSGYGFDNIGDVLSVSPVLLERYMLVARKVSRLAVGDSALKPSVDRFSAERGRQTDRVSEDLPFGTRGGIAIRYRFPLDGEYRFKITLRGDGEHPNDPFELTLPVKAGSRILGVAFPRESGKSEAVAPPRLQAEFRKVLLTGPNPDSNAGASQMDVRLDGVRVKMFDVAGSAFPQLDSLQIGGPFHPTGPGDTPSREAIYVCQAKRASQESPCAKKILTRLARRAYRRPATEADLLPLMKLYSIGRKTGSFDNGIEMALRGILVSPEFLYRVERDPAGAVAGSVHKVGDFELASRLSFFLWSSIPDEELLALAEKKRLRDPEVLEQQVRRMLNDDRSTALVTNFAGQWLYLRNMAQVKPDPDEFPDFDESLRDAFLQQTRLFFTSILREDRSVVDLLDADYTYLNERLAKHYGFPDIHGSQMRRVALLEGDPIGDARRGLLGQGSILTVTSYPNRTSPVLRGKWILENLLGAPPPPPPANVPDLKSHNDKGTLLSLRQQMEMHRANPVCASCHARMDPLGFALENMDGVGKWRTQEAGSAVDPSGVLPNGTKFSGPGGLRSVLLSKRDDFAGTVAEKLFTYALGRGIEYYDEPAVREIAREASKDNYRLSALIQAVVRSESFQMRRSQEQ